MYAVHSRSINLSWLLEIGKDADATKMMRFAILTKDG
jgi:hypothetical protein